MPRLENVISGKPCEKIYEKKYVKYICNNSYTRVFIRPRTVTKLRTLGQLRHRSVAMHTDAVVLFKAILTLF